jgi:hypothetical protein
MAAGKGHDPSHYERHSGRDSRPRHGADHLRSPHRDRNTNYKEDTHDPELDCSPDAKSV